MFVLRGSFVIELALPFASSPPGILFRFLGATSTFWVYEPFYSEKVSQVAVEMAGKPLTKVLWPGG
jgi:hypothetical protein